MTSCQHGVQNFEGVKLACAVRGCPRGWNGPDMVIVKLEPPEMRRSWAEQIYPDPGPPEMSPHERVWLVRVPIDSPPFVEWRRG